MSRPWDVDTTENERLARPDLSTVQSRMVRPRCTTDNRYPLLAHLQVFAGIFDRHPELKIITHHAGAMVPFFEKRIEYIYDTPGLPELREAAEAHRHIEDNHPFGKVVLIP